MPRGYFKESFWLVSALINDVLKYHMFQFMISFDNTASVGIALDDELHNFDLEKCGKNFLSSQGCTWSKIELEESERESTEISRGR